jgi:nitrogen fixation protein NifU and related proteins
VTREEIIEFLVDHSRAPSHSGTLENADVVMPGGNPGCGDTVTIYLDVDREHDRVAAIRFEGEGCTISQAAASILMDMVDGTPLASIEALEYQQMIDAVGREVAEMRPRCATLALGTLKAAVKKYRREEMHSSSKTNVEGAAPDRFEG